MKIFNSLDDFSQLRNAVITVGTFDGVHSGHLKLIERLRELASIEGGGSVILTFFPHPRMVLYPDDQDLKLLNTPSEKAALLEKAGIDTLIIHPFTKDFSRISATEFIRDVLIGKLKMKMIVIGYNHQFGRNREGTFEQLQEMSAIHHFGVEEIPEQDVNHIAVSSTKIREALLRGDIHVANALLGYEYMMSGKVVRGDGIGRTLGFPTANLNIPEDYKLIPCEGIYAVRVRHHKNEYKGMLYIGKRPVLKGKVRVAEVHLFDFDQNIYDETLQVSFVKKIREDMNFDSMNDLSVQMESDRRQALELL